MCAVVLLLLSPRRWLLIGRSSQNQNYSPAWTDRQLLSHGQYHGFSQVALLPLLVLSTSGWAGWQSATLLLAQSLYPDRFTSPSLSLRFLIPAAAALIFHLQPSRPDSPLLDPTSLRRRWLHRRIPLALC